MCNMLAVLGHCEGTMLVLHLQYIKLSNYVMYFRQLHGAELKYSVLQYIR